MDAPTVGIEIEIPWRVQLMRADLGAYYQLVRAGSFYKAHPDSKKRIQEGFDRADKRYKDAARKVLGEDIREAGGCDGFIEYSFAPTNDIRKITLLVHNLFGTHILNRNYYYPLHVTFGNISASQSAWIILTCMEIFGGTSPERLLELGTWSKKGIAGVKDRHPAELELDAVTGVELRSLVLCSPNQLLKILHLGQLVGVEVMNNTIKVQRLKHAIATGLQEKNMPCYQWKNPQDDQTPWIQLSKAFEDPVWINSMRSRISSVVFS